MRVIDIVPGTSVDGPGLRTAIYFAGCSHHCPGCHNPQSWDAAAGRDMSVDELVKIVEEEGFDVTFTGGDPMMQARELCDLARELNSRGRGIWCYTGYLYEHAAADAVMSELLKYVDVLVDGPYVEASRDPGLLFRGSSNQRLVDVRRSTPGDIVLWDEDAVKVCL